jgi:hypothetical protein
MGSWLFHFWAVDLCDYIGCAHIASLHPQDLLLTHLTTMLPSLEGNVIVTVQGQSRCAKCCWPTHVESLDVWIMFGCGSGSVIAACHLYQNMVPGQWIPFSNTDKQQDDEDKGQCWHQVWKLESWMMLLNILGPAHGGLQLLEHLVHLAVQ